MRPDPSTPPVPPNIPTSLIAMDESGSRSSGSNFFVMSAVKIRQSGRVSRALREVRDRSGFTGEFKFSDLTRDALVPYYEVIDVLADADVNLAATIVDKQFHNPFVGRAAWESHAEVAGQLLVGCIVRRELVSVIFDGISTPPDVAYDDVVRTQVNRRLRSTSIITATCLDSKTSDLLQCADLVASAVAFERRRQAQETGQDPAKNVNSPKAKVARRLRDAFGLDDFSDQRSQRVNIATMRPPRRVVPRPAQPVPAARLTSGNQPRMLRSGSA